jgi:hypothetical protein
MSSTVALASSLSVSPKVLTQANMIMGPDLLVNKKHQSSQSETGLDLTVSDMTDLLPSEWPAQMQASLCTLPPITWVTTGTTVMQACLSISTAMITSHKIHFRCIFNGY